MHFSGTEHRAEAQMVSGDKEADHWQLSQVNTWPSQAGCAWWKRWGWERQATSRYVYLWSAIFTCDDEYFVFYLLASVFTIVTSVIFIKLSYHTLGIIFSGHIAEFGTVNVADITKVIKTSGCRQHSSWRRSELLFSICRRNKWLSLLENDSSYP